MLDRDTSQAIIDALRSGTVPGTGLEQLAVGIEPMRAVFKEGRDWVAGQHARYKFIRGPYGAGKTFATSLAAADALADNFVTSKVVISVNDTPLYRLSEVYRKLCQGMSIRSKQYGALGSILEKWLFAVEQQVIELDKVEESAPNFEAAVAQRMETNLGVLGERAGRLASCLKAFHAAQLANDFQERQGILDWMAGEPKVNASVKRAAGVSGQLDNTDALTFLRGWLEVFHQARYRGLLLVLDEVEVILRMKRPERLKSLEVLRQLVDAIDRNEFPGLYLMVTGTPDLFDTAQGVPSLEPLHDRIKVTFRDDQPENLRHAQVRLRAFDLERLNIVGRKVRDIYPWTGGTAARVPDALIDRMAGEVTAGFGGHVDVVPRLFLRELVNVLDLVDQHSDYRVESWTYRPASMGANDLRPEEEEALVTARRDVSF